jgi:hypothetical protein
MGFGRSTLDKLGGCSMKDNEGRNNKGRMENTIKGIVKESGYVGDIDDKIKYNQNRSWIQSEVFLKESCFSRMIQLELLNVGNFSRII